MLTGCLAGHFVRAIGQKADIPKRLTLFGDKDRVAEFQVDNRIQEREGEGNVVGIGEGLGEWLFGGHAMTGFTLHVLNVFLIGVDVAVAHDFAASMAVHAVEGVFALSELRDWLVVIVDAQGGMITAFGESHCAQVVVAAVMAGIALGVWDCRCVGVIASRMTG